MGSTTTLVRVIGITLVALLSLASGRSLIPGLCATQAALDDSCSGRASCCDSPSQRSTDGHPLVRTEVDVACAFCSLATTLATATAAIEIETSTAPAPMGRLLADAFIQAAAIDRTHAGRAPPALSAV